MHLIDHVGKLVDVKFRDRGDFIDFLLLAIVVGLRFVDTGDISISPMGWIPLGLGMVLLLYSYVLYPDLTSLSSSILSSPSNDPKAREQD